MNNPNSHARKNIRPGLNVPSGLDPELDKFLQSVKEHLQGADGTRGQPKERFVTLGDLETAGLIKTGVKNGRGVITSAVIAGSPTASASAAELSSLGGVLFTQPIADGALMLFRSDVAQWRNGEFVSSPEIDIAVDTGTMQVSASIVAGSVAYDRLVVADALSVLGRSSDSPGVLDEIAAATDHNILRRSGTAIAFGSIDLSKSGAVGSSRLALANIAQITGQAVLGVPSAGAGNLAAISAGTNDSVLRQTAGTLNFGQLTSDMFPNAVVPDAALSSNVPLLSASNMFTSAGVGPTTAAINLSSSSPFIRWDETDASTNNRVWMLGPSGSNWLLGLAVDGGDALAAVPILVGRSGTTVTNIDLTASTTTVIGELKAATVASSTSTTLAAGQLHFITSNATLPNLNAGQWVQVVNDSASAITISKNASDTTYYTLTGATISTSFTLAARGVLTARCNPAGSAVYVSGSGITGAS